MTDATFTKRYQDPHRAGAAAAHRDWLANLKCDVRVPALLSARPHQLVFERLDHRRPGPADVDVLAQALGRLHAAAYTAHLHTAQLDKPLPVTNDLVIDDFVTPRLGALARMSLPVAALPAAFYKDANVRNFLLIDEGVAIVDFDDLTLAPFGYDLAKLVVSIAMTHGHLDSCRVEQALVSYNTYTAQQDVDTACSPGQLRIYAEFHHQLTARYLHRNGYRYAWPDVRPWREPKEAR